ncbi:NAD(P)H-dependent glycerol-3-phosphate dehydrogenase [Campylobacter geochelonis]|uniref:Glycerol-3-phosphate dehydrogenase [NAD(P)+] n=2 Tax=Campylobacter geochelonis TaxID=1780362 RepID=A0A128EJA7_9BACT|nr:glycerol-3-phosphate dehydrogenase [Campylobacter geochelonis]CZE48263.1 NAD(P)H-dependent glycerol-3-phosphate dehydrogenase [Campylobacter geochelonis]CZE48960.1 NAD(P)H-dependent glycerol-3-phosphate dehydrogenase [Campylobacter geochelonis]CZE50045.1 NAD(P)H-dependent glycerol-3-phosphate dehydrogenase [Campylobacter geochelonis]
MKIAVIGAGKWGEALFNAFSENNECVITSRTKKNIKNFVNLKQALEAEYLVFSLSTQITASWLKENFINKNQKILIASKGIDAKSGKFLNEIFEEYTDSSNLTFLSGPSFASEVMQKLPCAVVVSSKNTALAATFASFFPSYIKAYWASDVVGAEICGAYKNIIAIASGICDGLNLGNNARASLIARGLVEMSRFGKFFGAQDDTFLGLSGAGDLFLTASSALSRNYRVGFGLAKGKSLDEILSELGEVAEGVLTSKAVLSLANKHQIYTPIATEVALIMDGKNPKDSMIDLLRKK